LRLLILVGLSIIASSCSLQKVQIDILVLPDLEFDSKPERVALVNRVDYSNAYTKQYINGVIVEQYTDMSKVYTYVTMEQLKVRLEKDGRIETETKNPIYLPRTGEFYGAPLLPEYSQKICKDLKANAIVTIEGYDAEIDTDGQVIYSTPVEMIYGTVRIPYFEGNQNVQMRMFYRVYSCWEKTRVLYESEIGAQMTHSRSASRPNELQMNMPDKDNVMFDVARELGNQISEQLLPHWERQSREIYRSGSKEMVQAAEKVKENDWIAATSLWYHLADSQDKKLAEKASYNLIIASEVSNDLDLALEWAKLCRDQYGNLKAGDQIDRLQKRKEEIESLNELFPSFLH
jgi:hypothetical protein